MDEYKNVFGDLNFTFCGQSVYRYCKFVKTDGNISVFETEKKEIIMIAGPFYFETVKTFAKENKCY